MFGWELREKVEIKKVRTIRVLATNSVECAIKSTDDVTDWMDEMGILLIYCDIKKLDDGNGNLIRITMLSTKKAYGMVKDLLFKAIANNNPYKE